MTTGLNILLVEDDPNDAFLVQRLLVDAGVQAKCVVTRSNLQEGLAETDDGSFDVALIDLSLPDASGTEAIDRFRANRPDLPLVVLTGNENDESIANALRRGVEDYLLKGETSHGSLLLRALNFAIERKRARDERDRLEKHLLKVQRLESLEVMAGGVAHDFNNLLVGILGNASMILAELPRSSELTPLVGEIERSALLAADLTRQMLAYAGKGRFSVEVLDLSGLVQETQGLLQASASANAAFRFDLSSEPLPVRVDATQIQQTLMNLVSNASEALEGGRGTITVTTGRTVVDGNYAKALEYNQELRPGSYVFLEVTDTGIGMDASTRARIFDPFFSTKFTGRGLGLAACLGIARGHEGAYRVYSEPGQGTSFKVLLPLTSAQPDSEEAPPVASVRAGQILVVDDNESARNVARRILERAGFDVLLAADGREGLSLYSTHRSEVQLVLLDMTMPHMNGEETCRRLRLHDPDLRIVMMSGYNEQEIVRRLAGRGLAGFIQKPFQPRALVAKVAEVLEGNRDSSLA